MPLHVARLRDSDLAAEEDPEACWYALLLWAAAWHQIPAASLPDNDAVLTKLIGLGRDLKTFRKHRAGALRGFIKCDDGRLYHPVVAEQAVESWRRKLEQRWRTECGRVKKANQRNGLNNPMPTFEEFHATLPEGARLPDVPWDIGARPWGQTELSPGTDTPCPQGKEVQGTETGIGTGTGTILEISEDLFVDPSERSSKGLLEPEASDQFEAAWKAYPHVKGRSSKKLSLVQWRRLPTSTRQALPAAVAAYAKDGREPKMDCGAQAMERWLRDEKFADWLQPVGGRLGADWPDSRWRIAIDLWRQDGSWSADLGPTPGEPGCRVPAHLLVTNTSRSAA